MPRRETESRSAKLREGSDARARRARRERRRRSAYLLACTLRGQRLVHRLETPPQHAVQTRAHLLVAHNRRLAVPHQRILPAPARGLVHADGHEATHQWVRVRVILPNRHRRVELPGADAPGPADTAREGEVTNSPSPGTFRNNESARRAMRLVGSEVWPAPVSRRCANVTGLRPTRQENEETFPARRKRGHSEARDPRSSTRRVAPPTEMATEEIQFDPDVHPSYVGRLVKVRESQDDPHWRHGVCCFAMTEWAMEDYHGDGKLVKVEKITGGYQLQWGLFERVEQAREQKRKQQKVRDSPPTPTSLVVAAPIRIARDSSFPDARPLPSPRSSRARTTPSTWTS